jgi:hypothetical protein
MVSPKRPRDLLDGIPLYKPIFGGIRHLAVGIYQRPTTHTTLILWCTASLSPHANPARKHRWDCETCYENFQEAHDVP